MKQSINRRMLCLLAAVLSALVLTLSACAEPLPEVQVLITYLQGDETVTVEAQPVGDGDGAYWAMIPPEALMNAQILVLNPLQPELQYSVQLDPYGQMSVRDAGNTLDPASAQTVIGVDAMGQILDSLQVYLSTTSAFPEITEGPAAGPVAGPAETVPDAGLNEGPAENVPEAGPAAPVEPATPASAAVTARWVSGDVLLYQETATVTAAQPVTFYANSFPGYVMDEGTPDSITVQLTQDGQASPADVVFSFHPLTASVQVMYVSDDGTLLSQQTVTLRALESTAVDRLSFDGYTPAEGTPERVNLVCDEAGHVTPDSVIFTYTRNRTSVSVRYVAEDGTVLGIREASLAPGESQVFLRESFPGYTPAEGTPESLTVSLHADGSLTPANPVFMYQKNKVSVEVKAVADDGTVLGSDSDTLAIGESRVFPRPSFAGYTPAEGTPESITVFVTEDGTVVPEERSFRFERIRFTVTANHMGDDGSVLKTEEARLLPGESHVFTRQAFDGYTADADTPEQVTVTVGADGSITPASVIFSYTRNRTAVTVDAVADNGSVLQTLTAELLPGESHTFARPSLEGYTPAEGTPDSLTVTLGADGRITPENRVFQFVQNRTQVTASFVVSDGTVLDTQTASLLPGDSFVFTRLSFEGYAADEGMPESVTVRCDEKGNVSQEHVLFTYHAEQKAPQTVDVTVTWVAEDDTVLQASTVQMALGTQQTFSLGSFEGYVPEENTPETLTVSVDAEGNVTPETPSFVFEEAPADVTETQAPEITDAPTQAPEITDAPTQTPEVTDAPAETPTAAPTDAPTLEPTQAPTQTPEPTPTAAPVEVPVVIHYTDLGSSPLSRDVTITVMSGSSVEIAPDAARVPEGYDPESAQSVTVTVSEDGTVVPEEVFFRFRHREAEETPIPMGELINRWSRTNTASVNVRKGPTKSGKALQQLRSGSEVFAIREEADSAGNKWTKVLVDGEEGYIMSQFLDIYTQAQSEDVQDTLPSPVPYVTPEATQTPTQAPMQTPTQAPTQAPTEEQPQITQTPTPTPPAATSAVTELPKATELPAQYTGYALTQGRIALRAEVSESDSSILTTLDASTLLSVSAQIYDTKGQAWSQVRTLDNALGFVKDADLRRINEQEAAYYIRQFEDSRATPTTAPTATATPVQVSGYATTIGDTIPFRNMADDKSVILGVLDKDARVYVAGQVYDAEGWPWHTVLYNGQWGYIRADMTRMLTAQEMQQASTGTVGQPGSSGSTAPGSTGQGPGQTGNAPASAGSGTAPGGSSTGPQSAQSLPQGPESVSTTPQPYNANSLSSYGYIYASNNGTVNVRKTASTQSSVVKRLRNYAFCLVLGSTEAGGKTWYQIQYDGEMGYVVSDYFHQMSLAELEEFMSSEEYQKGIANNAGTQATAAPIVSQEQKNVSTWTDPNSGLNVTYATWAPFATTAPLPTETATVEPTEAPTEEPTATPEATETVAPTEEATETPLPLATVEVVDPQEKGRSYTWVFLLVGAIVLGGGGYVYYLNVQNRRRAAQRAAQRKAQAQAQQRQGAAAAPRTGTYGAGGSASYSGSAGSASTASRSTASTSQTGAGQSVHPSAQPDRTGTGSRPSAGSANPYQRPTGVRTQSTTNTAVQPQNPAAGPQQTQAAEKPETVRPAQPAAATDSPSATNAESTPHVGRRMARRQQMKEQNPDSHT